MTSPNPTLSTENISLNNNPFIWGNIALIAAVPWLLALSMAGLAVGDPVFPAWFEILLLGFPAIALTTWVQWQQPISPFSLWFVAKPNESLRDRDRQMLTLIKQHRNGWHTTGWIAAAVAILMSVIFCKIYLSAPLAQEIAPFPASLRLFGILWAEIFFLLSNILLQSGISALRIKLTAESELIGLQPFAVAKIKNSFTTIGWRSPQLLKFFEEEPETNNLVEGSKVASKVIEAYAPISEPEQITEKLQVEPILNKKDETEASAIAPDDSLIEPVLEPVETNQDQKILEEAKKLEPSELEPNEFIAEKQESESQNLDDELDENVAFNVYVENVLQEYLEDAEEVINPENQIPEDNTAELSTDSSDRDNQNPQYLVQEFLVDKFLDRLEELNIADKAKKATVEQTIENSSEPNSEVDEFEDLEALLRENLSDRNS